eukprot:gene5631-6327_t
MSVVEASWRFGRYVCQLKRLTLNYCQRSGSSRGIREYLEKEVISFAEKNPSISIYISERKTRHPRLVANYLNEQSKVISVKNMEVEEISEWLERLKNESGKLWRTEKIRKPWHTDTPSIQGTWNPLLNKPPPNMY